ncbi:MAG: (4Fe-4S)-binding protein, partial [Chitinophagaceae bacterium]|nr:(4Fe-4S)-binding protein [Anaerolineae bacterium]
MTEKYTGNDRRYTGEAADITYNVKRCIHAAFCVTRLS